MKQLARRGLRVVSEEGVRVALRKSSQYTARSALHHLGKRGLYGSDRFRQLLIYKNSGYGQYEAIADPFAIYRIDPAKITHVTKRGPNPGQFQWIDIGKIQGGEWDQSKDTFDDLPVVEALQERYEAGKSWEDIQFIRDVIDKANQGIVRWRGCTSEADVWQACEEVDHLFESIQNEGYKSRNELVNAGKVSPDKYVEGDGLNRYDEVVVDINRDGQFLFVDGRHRMAIAKLLSLPAIPIRISVRHRLWQETREQFRDTPEEEQANDDQLINHSDIETLFH